MEKFFLDFGMSWKMSLIMPYIVLILIGIALYIFVKGVFKKKWLKWSTISLIVIPALVYMIFSPIYSEDFQNNPRVLQPKTAYVDIKPNTLTVLSIPYCPFCEEAVGTVNEMVKRTEGTLDVNFVVCTNDFSTLDFYESKVDKGVDVKIVKDLNGMVDLADRHFPAFVYLKNGVLRVWSNNDFGAEARDWVESKAK